MIPTQHSKNSVFQFFLLNPANPQDKAITTISTKQLQTQIYIRGFEKFLMEGAYSRCQLFATEVHYFNIFEINFDSGNEKIAKENQVVREV